MSSRYPDIFDDKLKKAIDKNDLRKVKEILAKSSNPDKINVTDNRGITPLLYSCGNIEQIDKKEFINFCEMFAEKYKLIKFLLSCGARIDSGARIDRIWENIPYFPPLPLMTACLTYIRCIHHNKYIEAEKIIKIIKLLSKYDAISSRTVIITESFYSARENLEAKFSIIDLIEIFLEDMTMISSKNDNSELSIFIKVAKKNIRKIRDLNKKIEKKDSEIERLKKENEALRYQPGNPGYWETKRDFYELVDKKK